MFDSAAQYKRHSRVPSEEIAQESVLAGIVKDASNTKLHWNLEWLKWHLYMKVGESTEYYRNSKYKWLVDIMVVSAISAITRIACAC